MDGLEYQESEEVQPSRTKVPPIVVHTPIRNYKSSLETVTKCLKGEMLMKSKGSRTIFYAQNIEDYNTLNHFFDLFS